MDLARNIVTPVESGETLGVLDTCDNWHMCAKQDQLCIHT